jgi:hypothetical protein
MRMPIKGFLRVLGFSSAGARVVDELIRLTTELSTSNIEHPTSNVLMGKVSAQPLLHAER